MTKVLDFINGMHFQIKCKGKQCKTLV